VSDHADVLRLTALAEGRAEVHLLTADRERLKATLAELAALRAEVGILSAAKAGARYIAERDTLRQRLADIEAGHGMRAHECCDEVIRLRLRLEEAVKKHAVCVSTIDCLQRDLGALEQRLAEVEAQNRLLETWRAKHAKAPDLTPAPDPLQQGYCSGHCDHVRCRAAMSGGEIVLPESALAPVAEQSQPALPHMLLVLTHKQTTGGCARCGKDWPCPDAPQPAKASTEPAGCPCNHETHSHDYCTGNNCTGKDPDYGF
jgi:hypothetical protein